MTTFSPAEIHDGAGCTCRGSEVDNYPVPILDVNDREVCNRCGCWWDMEATREPNAKGEWCQELDHLPESCYCHSSEYFVDNFLERMDRINADNEWRRLRDSGLSEGELAARSGTG